MVRGKIIFLPLQCHFFSLNIFFFFGCAAGDEAPLVADQGSNPHPASPTVEARSLNHWTAREDLATALL